MRSLSDDLLLITEFLIAKGDFHQKNAFYRKVNAIAKWYLNACMIQKHIFLKVNITWYSETLKSLRMRTKVNKNKISKNQYEM